MAEQTGYELDTVKVLIVDDSLHMRQILKSLLNGLGIHGVIEAEDGGEAYNLLQEHDVDLVLCDLIMEPVDGFTFVENVRTRDDSPDPFLPIIIISGYTERFRVHEARDHGATEVLAKPISAKELASKIRAVIETPRPFIKAREYFGPDRRRARKSDLFYTGEERRTNMFSIEEQLSADFDEKKPKASQQAVRDEFENLDDILDFDLDDE